MRAYFIMLTKDKMAAAATLEISFTESFNLVLKSLKSRKIAIDVDRMWNMSINLESQWRCVLERISRL